MMKLERILVLDDDSSVRSVVTDLLREMEFTVLGVPSIAQARTLMNEDPFDLVLCDMRLQDGNGLEFLQEIKQDFPGVQMMLMTGFGSLDSAVEALRIGVFDYLIKPIDASRLSIAVERLQEVLKLEAENVYLREAAAEKELEGVEWGTSPAMLRVQEVISKISKTDATVLVQGESGTGKEVISRRLHAGGARAEEAFIRVNCAAIPSNLLESEFFGHEKGAFTGAVDRRVGRFELANRGTLLLDEISEIPPDLQVKLLRVLQEQEFERVGGNKTIKVDVRVIATTNRNLEEEVKQGHFREDLFYRLNVVPIEVPALRERGDDIILLVNHFIKQFARKHGKRVRPISHDLELFLRAYNWPGNVRELQNAIERAAILVGEEGVLGREEFPMIAKVREESKSEKGSDHIIPIAELEKQMILKALDRCGGNRTHAAELLEISIRTMRNKLAQYRKEGIEIADAPLHRRREK